MTAHDYEYLQRLVRLRSGLVLDTGKRHLVERRLRPVARRAGLVDFAGLVARLRAPGAEPLIVEVVEAMTASDTQFFRDRATFDRFRDTIVPAMRTVRAPSRRLRIWCAGAGTGQEPYTLAMVLKAMGRELQGWRVEILATDLSGAALEKARAGIYTQSEVQRGLSALMLIRYFSQVGRAWQIAPEIRGMVTFMPFNLLDAFSHLGPFDLVFCRNVLDGFDPATRTDVLGRIAEATVPDGFLVLGAAETASAAERFRPVAGGHGLYRRNARGWDGRDTPMEDPRIGDTAVGGHSNVIRFDPSRFRARAPKAFSSEAGTGSREENALK